MEELQENNIAGEKIGLLTRKKSNSHYLPPMGLVVVFCTMMLAGRSIRQNYFCAYSESVSQALLPANPLSISDNTPQKQTDQEAEKNEVKINNFENIHVETDTTIKTTVEEIITEKPQEKKELKDSNTIKIANTDVNVNVNDNVDVESDAINKMNNQQEQENTEAANKIDNANNILNKQRTSEPIIYLFVFVFIYLLLKSVADINSHYKTKMNGDTRLRRHSLQSYAHIHRYDNPRRASRVQPDLPNYSGPAVRKLTSNSNELNIEKNINNLNNQSLHNLIKQRTLDGTTYLDNEHCTVVFENMLKRRCSLPVIQSPYSRALSFQHSDALGANGNQQNGVMETKRRVRMINRH